jgi:hypothetical protein
MVLLVTWYSFHPGNKLPGYYFGHAYGIFADLRLITYFIEFLPSSVSPLTSLIFRNMDLAFLDYKCQYDSLANHLIKASFTQPSQISGTHDPEALHHSLFEIHILLYTLSTYFMKVQLVLYS